MSRKDCKTCPGGVNRPNRLNNTVRKPMADANDKPNYPSLARQGVNLAKLATAAARQAVAGNAVYVPAEVKNQRLAICKSCTHYDPNQGRCKKCGCFLEAKTSFAASECPVLKWTNYQKPVSG